MGERETIHRRHNFLAPPRNSSRWSGDVRQYRQHRDSCRGGCACRSFRDQLDHRVLDRLRSGDWHGNSHSSRPACDRSSCLPPSSREKVMLLLTGVTLTALGLALVVTPFAYGIFRGFTQRHYLCLWHIRARAAVFVLGIDLILIHFALLGLNRPHTEGFVLGFSILVAVLALVMGFTAFNEFFNGRSPPRNQRR